jgi:NADH-quinone oxidoreductase subunit A
VNDFTNSVRPNHGTMLQSYLPLLILLGISAAQAIGMVVLSEVLSPTKRTRVKSAPYESGIDPIGSTRERFSMKFYLVAIIFIVFDVETVFLLPWAVVMREVGVAGFISASIFIFILTVGLVYEWKKGALEWT